MVLETPAVLEDIVVDFLPMAAEVLPSTTGYEVDVVTFLVAEIIVGLVDLIETGKTTCKVQMVLNDDITSLASSSVVLVVHVRFAIPILVRIEMLVYVLGTNEASNMFSLANSEPAYGKIVSLVAMASPTSMHVYAMVVA